MTLPDGWLIKPLAEVAQVVMGQSPDSKYYSAEEVGLPFLQGCAEFQGRHPKHAIYCSHSKKIGCAGSILLSVRAPVGSLNVANRDYVIGRGLAALNGTRVTQDFLEHFLAFQKPKFRLASQGSTFEAINSSELKQWPILHPKDKAEQSKIAEVLSTVDRAIEQAEALIAKQQRIKTGLMQDLLTRGIDEHGNLRSEQTHEFKDSRLGRIPIEWEVRSMSELTTEIVDGVHHTPTYTSSGVPFIVVSDLTSGIGIDFNHTRFVSEAAHTEYAKRVEPRSGDVLVSKDGTLGVARIVPDGAPRFSIFVSVALLRPQHRLCIADLLWSFFDSGVFYRQLGALSAGTGLAHIHLEHFRKFQLRCPRIDEQGRIFAVITAQSRLLTEYTDALQKLRSVRTALTQDLLTGKRRVTALLEQREEVTT